MPDRVRTGTQAALPRGRQLPVLLVGRVAEQGVLGGIALLVAARLGTEAFAPVAALLVITSAAVTLSDWGVGLAVLRRAPGDRIASGARRSMRLVNAGIVLGSLPTGLVVGGDMGTVIVAGGVVWWSSAEAFVAKAAAVHAGAGNRAATAELVGAVVAGAIVVAFASGAAAVAVVGGALVAKQLLEIVVTPAPDAFAPDGRHTDTRAIWATQMTAFAVANVDFLVVATVLGARAFSVYTVGYRVAVAIPSVVASVATRTALADLGAASGRAELEARSAGYVRPLFVAGIVGALAAVAAAFVLPVLLGGGWGEVRPTLIVLAVAVPWRMIFGQAGALALAAGRAWTLVRWEVAQLLAFCCLLLAGAAIGYGAFVGAASALWIVSVTLIERGAARAAGVRGWPGLRRAAGAAFVLVVVLTATTFT